MIRIKNPIAPRLPSEYQEVEYIETTSYTYNTNRIDTGVYFTNNTKIEMKINGKFNDYDVWYTAKSPYCGVQMWSNQFAIKWGSSAGTTVIAKYDFGNTTSKDWIVVQDKNKFYVNGSLIHTFENGTFKTTHPLMLLSAPEGDRDAKAKLYYTKIYENDVLVRDFVPCYRKSDNIVGLYDLVNNQFYTNAGTGVFLRGNEVNKRDINIKPMLGNKLLIRRYAGDKLVYGREPGSYEQLVNYTMLYDNGNECTDITGGWENSFTQGGGTFTKNLDHLYLYVKGSTWKKCAGTKNKIDMSLFSKIYTRCKASRTSASPGICSWGLTSEFESNLDGNAEQISRGWILTDSNTFDGFRTLDLSTITNAHVNFKVQSNSYSNATTLYIYDVFMVKEDDWQTLASIAGITASSIDDILSNSSTLLANKEAVDFMMYQCTGSFMASAIQSSTFLTALNNSSYNTVIQANEHWNKFLSMVA